MSGLDKLDIPVNNSDFETVPVGTMAKLEELVDKCNALASHVRDLAYIARGYRDGSKTAFALDMVLEETPATSLARLKEAWKFDVLNELADKKKAEWQAEAYDLSAYLVKLEGPDDSRLIAFRKKLSTRLDGIAAELRRQAEGINSANENT